MTTELRESSMRGDASGGFIMSRSESRRAGQGGQIQMTTARPSRGGTVTFEGEYATITFERSIRHPIHVVWEALTESEHLARWYMTRAHDSGPDRSGLAAPAVGGDAAHSGHVARQAPRRKRGRSRDRA